MLTMYCQKRQAVILRKRKKSAIFLFNVVDKQLFPNYNLHRLLGWSEYFGGLIVFYFRSDLILDGYSINHLQFAQK